MESQPEVLSISQTEVLSIFYDGILKILETHSVHIFQADMTRIDKVTKIEDIYTAISKPNNQCREFGIFSLDTVLPGVELLYDAEYIARNPNAEPNHMATDLFGHLLGDVIFGVVVLRCV